MDDVEEEPSDPIHELVEAVSKQLLGVIAVAVDELSAEVQRLRALLDLLEGDDKTDSDAPIVTCKGYRPAGAKDD